MCITTLALFLVFWIAFQQKSLVDDRWLKFGLIVMVQGFTWAFHVGTPGVLCSLEPRESTDNADAHSQSMPLGWLSTFGPLNIEPWHLPCLSWPRMLARRSELSYCDKTMRPSTQRASRELLAWQQLRWAPRWHRVCSIPGPTRGLTEG